MSAPTQPTPAAPVSAARNSLLTLVTRLISLPLGLVSSLVLARTLGDESLGGYRYLLLFNGLWLPIATLGLGGATIYLLSSRRYTAAQIWPTVLGFGALQGLMVLALAAILYPLNLLGGIAEELPSAFIAATLLILPLQGMYLMGTRVLVGDSRFGASNLQHLVSICAPFALQVLLLVVWPWAAHRAFLDPQAWFIHPLWGALLAYILATLFQTVILIWQLWSNYTPERWWNQAFTSDSLTYGWKVWWGDITTRLNLRGDQWILSYFVSKADLGQYGLAVTLSEILWNIPDSLNYVLFNKLSAERQDTVRVQLTERVHRVLFWVMLALIGGAAAASPWLIPLLYGPKFQPAVQPLLWLLPGTLFLTTTKVITKYFGAVGRPGLSSVTTVAGTIIGLGTCWAMLWFMPHWGITGAALASSLGYFCSALLALGLYKWLTRPHKTHFFRMRLPDWLWFREQFRRVV
ncbi:MAG: flippase [Pirellulales bacterium]|nr:flippase [Pirellulales bacterium]